MILVWNNKCSFKQHLEDMRLFHQAHSNEQRVESSIIEEVKMLKDMALLSDVQPPHETVLVRSITDTRGKIVIVPIWEIILARGSQN